MLAMKAAVSALALAVSLAACTTNAGDTSPNLAAAPQAASDAPQPAAAPASGEAAQAFVVRAEKELADLNVIQQRADWVNATYITDDTDALAAHFGALNTELRVRLAGEAARYADAPGLDADTRRKLDMLRGSLTLPAPATAGAATELSQITTRLQSTYGKGKGTLRGQPISGSDIEAAMGTNRNPAELKEMWTSWHTNVGTPMRADYARMVEIANQGAKELGYTDVGSLWRSKYDMPPDEFAALTDKLWAEVKPLYDQLHCYTRAKLNDKYGDAVSPKRGRSAPTCSATCGRRNGATSTTWSRPRAPGDIGYNLTSLLEQKKYTPEKIVKTGRAVLQLARFRAAPQELLGALDDHQAAGPGSGLPRSAWDVDNVEDLRIKMCTKVNADDFVTVHHELGTITISGPTTSSHSFTSTAPMTASTRRSAT
jgi:peptidyl-dipeptidase A